MEAVHQLCRVPLHSSLRELKHHVLKIEGSSDGLLEIRERGKISRNKEGTNMASPPNLDGIVGWLVWAFIATSTAFFSLWNKQMTGRIGRVEQQASTTEESIHKIEIGLSKKFSDYEIRQRDRQEAILKDIQLEFKDVRNRIDHGHRDIMKMLTDKEK